MRSLLIVEVRNTLFKLGNELVAESFLLLDDCVGLRHAWLTLFLFEEQKVSFQLILLGLDLGKLRADMGKFDFSGNLGQNILDLRLTARSYLHRLRIRVVNFILTYVTVDDNLTWRDIVVVVITGGRLGRLDFATDGILAFSCHLLPQTWVKLLHLRLLKLIKPVFRIEDAVREIMDVHDGGRLIDRGVLPATLTAYSLISFEILEIEYASQLCKVMTLGQISVPSCFRSKSRRGLQALLFDPELW